MNADPMEAFNAAWEGLDRARLAAMDAMESGETLDFERFAAILGGAHVNAEAAARLVRRAEIEWRAR